MSISVFDYVDVAQSYRVRDHADMYPTELIDYRGVLEIIRYKRRLVL